VLSSAHGKSSRSSARLSGTGAAALTGGAATEERNPSVRSGTAGAGASAVCQSLGPTSGSRGAIRFEEGGACRTQTSPECGGPEEDPARPEARAGNSGLRNRFVDGMAGSAPHRGGVWGPLPCLAGLAHLAATGLELPAAGGSCPGAEREEDPVVETEALARD